MGDWSSNCKTLCSSIWTFGHRTPSQIQGASQSKLGVDGRLGCLDQATTQPYRRPYRRPRPSPAPSASGKSCEGGGGGSHGFCMFKGCPSRSMTIMWLSSLARSYTVFTSSHSSSAKFEEVGCSNSLYSVSASRFARVYS